MTLFTRRKPLRYLASSMLLGWVFALGMGMVNACAAQPGPRHAPCAAAADGASDTAHQPAPADRDPCAKFCDDKTAATPAVKQVADVLPAPALAPPPAEPLALLALHEPPGAWRAQPSLARGRVPIAIAYLRLTL